jgi:hypothetical protein
MLTIVFPALILLLVFAVLVIVITPRGLLYLLLKAPVVGSTVVAFSLLVAAPVAFFDPGTKAGPSDGLLALAAFGGVLLLGWCAARLQRGTVAILGFGEHFYGRKPFDSGYLTTKWLVCLGLPILPVRSYHVLTGDSGQAPDASRFSWTSQVGLLWGSAVFVEPLLVSPLPGFGVSWRQAARTWLIASGGVVCLAVAVMVCFAYAANERRDSDERPKEEKPAALPGNRG